MWSFDRAFRLGRRLALGLALTALGACGFQPLYAEADGQGGGRLAVDVQRIAEREGQVLRAALRRAFDQDRPAEFVMTVRLSERIDDIAVDGRGDVIRKRMTLAAKWTLADPAAAPGTRPLTGDARAFEAFNILRSDFANLSAERAARERAARRLADQIAATATARAGQ